MKSPKHLGKNTFLVYSPRLIKIEPATHMKIDTEIVVFLPKNARGLLTSIFKTDEVNGLFNSKHRLWVKILNKSFEHTIKVERHSPLGIFVIDPENLKIHNVQTKKKAKKTKFCPRHKKQLGRFLNSYGFAYTGRGIVNHSRNQRC